MSPPCPVASSGGEQQPRSQKARTPALLLPGLCRMGPGKPAARGP